MPLFVGVLFTAVGAVALGYALWALWYAWGCAEWPHVTGVVMSSELDRERDADGSMTYRAEVAYRYTVAEREHVGTRVCFGDGVSTSWLGAAARRVARYHPQASVTVYYDPARPERAVLEPGADRQLYFLLAMGVVFAGLGCGLALGGTPWLQSIGRLITA